MTKTTTATVEPKVIYVSGDTTVVDRKAMATLGADALSNTMAAVYEKGKTAKVLYIDDAAKFFNLKSLETAIDTNSPTLGLLLNYHNIDLTAEDIDTITRARDIQKKIRDSVEAMREASRPAYKLAAVPKGWSVENDLQITSQLMRRIADGRYIIGLKAAERLWDWASQYWVGNTNSPPYHRVRASGDERYAQVNKTSITIGCQTIQRYELEQVALELGWTFPKANITID